tara:strand:- start:422 stop:559 length:138 start_codon:yes stop_codon:yes gene_type:complete
MLSQLVVVELVVLQIIKELLEQIHLLELYLQMVAEAVDLCQVLVM